MESLPQQQQQASSQEAEQAPPHFQPPPPVKSQRRKPPIRLVVSRAYTAVVLVISIVLLFTVKNGTQKVIGQPNGKDIATFKISDLGSLRSVLTASVIGAGCNLYQLGMLIYFMVTGKDFTPTKYKIFFDYYCDKAVALLLAASAGAGIGAMLDISKMLHPSMKTLGGFFSLGQISTTLLVTATVSTSVSSTCSSEALLDYKRTVVRGEKAVGILGPWANKLYNYCCHICG